MFTRVIIFLSIFEYHYILMLGRSLIKQRQRPSMTTAVDWGVKPQNEQINKQNNQPLLICMK